MILYKDIHPRIYYVTQNYDAGPCELAEMAKTRQAGIVATDFNPSDQN
jgi:hypothetical protein